MYFGGRQSAEMAQTIDLPFRCVHCGARRTARVEAVGRGSASSPYYIGHSRAHDRAIEDAEVDAHDLAHESLALVACPACGKLQRRARAFDPMMTLAFATVGGVGGMIVGAGGGAVIGALLGSLVALVGARMRALRGQLTAGTVTFFEGDPPDKPVIGARCKVCKKQIVMASDGVRCETCGAACHTKKCLDRHVKKKHAPPEGAFPYR